jgi:3-deoxy-D-manno-octulosonate 8-phosphate phosphatase (KDO 8-P phosphatase)
LIQAKAARVRLVLLDVDGVLTDGKVLLHPDGTESKNFDIKDGTGVVLAQRAGLTVGFLSARTSASTAHRAAQLGVTLVHQGVPSKLETYDQIVDAMLLEDEQIAYMGDDILDLPVLMRVGLAAAPGDAVDEVRKRVHWVSSRDGGNGAARELIELILSAQNQWDRIVAEYESAGQKHPVADTPERRAATRASAAAPRGDTE